MRTQQQIAVRRAMGDASGRAQPEKLSEYFDFSTWPEKADKAVKRHELVAIMQQYDRAKKALSPWGRFKTVMRGLWLFLTGAVGTRRPVIEAVPQPERKDG